MNEHIRVRALAGMEIGFRMVVASTAGHRMVVAVEAEAEEVCCTGSDRMEVGRTAVGVGCTDSGHTVAETRTADSSEMEKAATRMVPARDLVAEARTDKTKVDTVADWH